MGLSQRPISPPPLLDEVLRPGRPLSSLSSHTLPSSGGDVGVSLFLISKAALNRVTALVPNLYKNLYRRHHKTRSNWLHGRHKTISFPGHGTNVVTCLQFDEDKIVSGSDDMSIHIYETSTGVLRKRLVGHEGGVWALQYWGDSLVSGSTDRSVRVWDMDEGRCTHVFEGHTSTVRCLMIVPPTSENDQPSSAGGIEGGQMSAAHMASLLKKAGKSPTNDLPFPVIVTGSRDATLRVWRLPNPKTDPSFIPSAAAATLGSPNSGGTVGSSSNPYFMHVLNGHTASVRAIAGHGRILVSGSYDCTVRVWDLVTGQNLRCFRGHREKVYSVGYCDELKRAVSGSLDCSVRVWCVGTGALLFTLEGHTSLVGLLELSPRYLVSAAADATLRIWSPTTGQCLATLTGHTAPITCFHHDPHLNRIVSGSDGGVKVWELSSANPGGSGVIPNHPVVKNPSSNSWGPGFAFTQGPNGLQPVHGHFLKDIISNIQGVWRVRMDERRLVTALLKEGGQTWFQVLDFGDEIEPGTYIEGPGDGSETEAAGFGVGDDNVGAGDGGGGEEGGGGGGGDNDHSGGGSDGGAGGVFGGAGTRGGGGISTYGPDDNSINGRGLEGMGGIGLSDGSGAPLGDDSIVLRSQPNLEFPPFPGRSEFEGNVLNSNVQMALRANHAWRSRFRQNIHLGASDHIAPFPFPSFNLSGRPSFSSFNLQNTTEASLASTEPRPSSLTNETELEMDGGDNGDGDFAGGGSSSQSGVRPVSVKTRQMSNRGQLEGGSI